MITVIANVNTFTQLVKPFETEKNEATRHLLCLKYFVKPSGSMLGDRFFAYKTG